MFQTNPLQPPKKYIKDDKDGGGKLKLNPAYKAWKEGEANSNNNHAAATAAVIHYPVDDAHLPTAIAIADEFPPEETRSQIQASEQYQLQNRNNTTRPSQAEELRRWQDDTASLPPPPPPSAAEREVQRLRDENARLKTQQQYQQQYPPAFSQSMTTRPTPAPPMGMMTASLPPQYQRTYSPPPPSASSAPPGTTLFAVQVPTGVSAGQQFHISVQGTQFKVRCPPNVRSG